MTRMSEHFMGLREAVSPASGAVEWLASDAPVPYSEAVAFMEQRASAIARGEARECVWLLEHPPLYTAGTSADPAELIAPDRFPVFKTGRGGRFTYHGPGQRVAYVMLDLSRRGRDVRAFVQTLEAWMIAALGRLGVSGERRAGQIGVFVGEAKIASIGVRVRHWVTMHGVSINMAPDLEHFSGILPCGLSDPVTSLEVLGVKTDTALVDRALRETFVQVFGRETVSANDLSRPR
jgi:lipoyl(octanoyl) transferase